MCVLVVFSWTAWWSSLCRRVTDLEAFEPFSQSCWSQSHEPSDRTEHQGCCQHWCLIPVGPAAIWEHSSHRNAACSYLWAGRGAGHCKAQWSSSLKDAVCRHEVSHAALRADWWLQPMACRFLRLCKWQQPHGEQQTAGVLLLGGFNFRGKLLVCNF